MKRNTNSGNSRTRWRWSTIWSSGRFSRPFYSVTEQRAFDLEMVRLRAQHNVALTVSKVAYGLR
jgi:hypothetical protein